MAVDVIAAEELTESACEEPHPDATEAHAGEGLAHQELVDESGPRSGVGLGLKVGAVVALTLAGLVGWLSFRAYQSYEAQQQRHLFVQVARQGALNLTTIDYTAADADVRRILDSSAGSFHDEFEQRSRPFVEVVKQAQSKSEGHIVEAGLESVNGSQAQVLVAVNVKTSIAGTAEAEPRAWRMRITVQKAGDSAKVSSVEFVP